MTDFATAPERSGLDVSPFTPMEDARTIMLNRISWGALFAGIVISLVIQLLLSMLGIGVGAATLGPGSNPDAGTFSMVAGIWFVVAGIIAAFVGGWFAGRLCGRPVRSTAAIHGFATWAATTLIIFYLLTTAVGGVIGGAFSGISTAVSGLGNGAATTAATSPDMASHRMAQAEQRYGQTVQQAGRQAVQAANRAAPAVSTGALWGFVALVLGAIAGWLGGMVGTVVPVVTGAGRR